MGRAYTPGMPEPEFTSYDREVLYEQVWAEPVRDVARRYGVSDVALAKACRRLSVPLPGRGYWAKRGAGTAPPRPPLPDAPGPRRVPVTGALAGTSSQGEDKDPVPEVKVPAALRRPHELVVPARAALEEARAWHGLASCASKGCLDITVSKEQRQRALRVMDALVCYLEANAGGVEVTASREYRYGYEEQTFATEALVGGERIGFALREHYGQLELRLTNDRLHGLRRTWSDGKRQRLEDIFGKFVAGLGHAAVQLAEIHAEDERRRLARLEAERRRAEEAERRRLREEKIARLTGEAAAWSRAAELRAYAMAAMTLLDEHGTEGEAAATRRADVVWLLTYADSIDPLRGDG
jgi:hypothetical protein